MVDLGKALEENKKGIQIFLFDSGELTFYKAKLVAIDGASGVATKKNAPDQGLYTPAYYNGDCLLGWLKLESINKVSRIDLKKFSYVQLNGLYLNESDPDEQLFNKIVFSSEELKKAG